MMRAAGGGWENVIQMMTFLTRRDDVPRLRVRHVPGRPRQRQGAGDVRPDRGQRRLTRQVGGGALVSAS